MYKRNFLSGWSAALSFIVMWSALLTGFGAVKAFAADEDAAAPVIVTQPQDQTANEGATATLSVTANASGSGTLTYQWYRNGSNSTSGATQIMNATGASYTVPNVAAGDLYYYVVVTNADTTATGNQTATTTSSVAKVTGNALTHAAVPVIVTQPQDQTVNEGATATLSVNISGEALTFQWYRNTSNSTSGATQIMNATGASYTVPNVAAGDLYYYVVVTNTDTTATGNQTATATSRVVKVTGIALTHAAAPVIVTEPQDQTANEGATATLSVNISGEALTFQWYRNTSNSTSGATQIMNATGASYTVPNVAAGDLYYYVVVTNTDTTATGNQTATATSRVVKVTGIALTHAAAPVIVTEPQDQTANEGAAATLSVTANISGSGTLTYQWYRNTSNSTNGAAPIFGATGASYTVPTAAVGDLYYYAIVTNTDATATGNQTATATSSVAKVTVEALPPAITSTVVSAAPDPSIWGTTVTLTAAVTAISATPSGTVSFYDGNTLLDTATLSGSTAVMTTSVLSIGTHTITATYNGNANFVGSTGTTTVTVQAVPTYTIAAIANQVASSLIQGYATSSIETKTIQVTNNGTGNLTNVSVTLSGANANQFIITQPAVTVNTGDSTSFTVRAKDGLTAGTYAATVTVSASNMTDVSFSVTQTVNAPTPVYPVIGTASPGSASTDVEVLVNGKAEKAGTASTSTVNNQTVTKVAVDQNKLENKLAEEGQGAIVTIQVKASSDVVIVGLNGQMVQNMESKQAILEFKTNHATYTLPVQHIDWESLSEELGKSVDLQDISVEIEIAKPKAETVQAIEDAAEQGGFTIVAPPLNFTVTVKYGDKTIQLSTFDAYVKRMIAIPDGVDANKLTTGVVLEPDGTVRHVPTMVSNIDGTYYAQISSLINSTYAVIWNPVEFRDMANHWANDAVNDMGSRLIVTGTVTGRYHPDRDISRAEFAAIAVRALGLKLENGASPFSDVKDSDWYSSAINTAYAYKLISGYEDGTFRPAEKITREQAMVIIAKAMKITKLNDKLSADQIEAALRSLTDAEDASNWARSGIADCIGAGIVSGRNGIELAPQASITRAEVAVIVERLLTKSGLI